MKYKHILFDLDRTLWDFKSNSFLTFKEMFDTFDLATLCNTEFEKFYAEYKTINSTLWDMYRRGTLTKELLYVKRFSLTLEHFGITNHSELSRKLGDFYVLEGPKKTTLIDGAIEVLDYLLAKNYPIYIVSNGFKEVQNEKIITSKIDKYFKKVYLSEDIGAQKPNRKIFDAVVSDLKTTASECVMIGDDFGVDIEGAKNAGIDQIYFNPDQNNNPFEPTYEVKSLVEICSIL
ncbi:MAG: YjjG family noncanonical pyrimidine nucleotidase [Bacteroidales bacterium]|nr:YjjG family noncanonical pyrimidine nucleotidase [Bacteroidales bacterium]